MKKIAGKSVMNQSQGKQLVEKLVRDFSDNQEYFLSEQFNETEVRNRFIDPFFKALGWEFDQTHLSPEFWDVHREYSQKEGSVNKKPDYAFRIDGKLKFFTEAKAPHVRLEDKNPAHQAKRYAFSTSGKAPVVILTNFYKLKVFNALERPVHNNPLQGLLGGFDLTYLQYPKKWDMLYSHFSKQAVSSGSLDVLARKISKNTRKMDDEFLDDISRWREQMAVKLADLNQKMNEDELNEAVQRILDRMIFLRNLEDRDLETENTLLKIAHGDAPAYPQLVKIFNGLNEFYNGLLFKPHFSENIRVDDKLLKTVIRQMCYPESPFRFDVIEPEILGHIYERFLGSEIRLIAKSKAVVEEKPEVRKAGGVYYTPQYIVDYIVKNTVGEKIEGMTPEEIRAVRILDPACGSGSFLLGAFDILIKYHEKWYDKHRKNKDYRHDFYTMPDGKVKLTPAKKADILKKNIFGVDIDREATEVAMMSLYLKLMDNSVSKNQMELMSGHVLPDLTCNIKCGNSLIGSDFYNSQERLSFEEQKRINALDWEKEFADIMKSGGFDCVIGNPPWGADIRDNEKVYFRNRYKLNSGKFESYIFFIEKANILLKQESLFGFIIPSYWISRSQTESVRNHLCGELWTSALIVLPENVFDKVRMDSCIVIASRKKKQDIQIAEIQKNDLSEIDSEFHLQNFHRTVHLTDWLKNAHHRFNPRIYVEDMPILDKIEYFGSNLGKFVEISQGLTLYRRTTLAEKFGKAKSEQIVNERLFHSNYKKDDTFKKELSGRDVSRYYVEWNQNSWVSYGPWLAHAVDERFLKGPRLVIQKLRNPTLKQRLIVGYLDDNETYSAGVLLNVILKKEQLYSLHYFMGLLNSKLLNYWYRKSILDVSIRVVDLSNLPIRTINFDNPQDKSGHDKIVELVEHMLSLNKQLSQAKSSKDKDILKRQIDLTDSEIDRLVYKLYDLTPEEIEFVEGKA